MYCKIIIIIMIIIIMLMLMQSFSSGGIKFYDSLISFTFPIPPHTQSIFPVGRDHTSSCIFKRDF